MNHLRLIVFLLFFWGSIFHTQAKNSGFVSNSNYNKTFIELIDFINQYENYSLYPIVNQSVNVLDGNDEIFSRLVQHNLYVSFYQVYLNGSNKTGISLYLTGIILVLVVVLVVMLRRYNFYKRKLSELTGKNIELEGAKKKAEDANRLKTEFISNISHEIRTPMNAIQGFIELIDAETSQEELSKFLKIISKSSESLMKTVDDLMQISRIKAKQVNVKNRTFSLNYLLDSIYSIAKQKVHEKQKRIEIRKNYANDFEITTDYTILITILTHIIDNSVKFTNSGELVISTFSNNGFAEIEISDTGIGFDMLKAELITAEFYKIHNNDKLFRGSGVGLSIASKLALLIGANLEIQSEPGVGTKVCLKFYKN